MLPTSRCPTLGGPSYWVMTCICFGILACRLDSRWQFLFETQRIKITYLNACMVFVFHFYYFTHCFFNSIPQKKFVHVQWNTKNWHPLPYKEDRQCSLAGE